MKGRAKQRRAGEGRGGKGREGKGRGREGKRKGNGKGKGREEDCKVFYKAMKDKDKRPDSDWAQDRRHKGPGDWTGYIITNAQDSLRREE